jgi:SEC-C motif-containing protein
MMRENNCPCGNNLSYNDCCELIHKDQSKALTAEHLMRSRYTAFTMANGDYMVESHLESHRPENDKKQIVAWAKSVDWLRLEIIQTESGLEENKAGIVEFNAFFQEGEHIKCLHEVSSFIKLKDIWYYVEAMNT